MHKKAILILFLLTAVTFGDCLFNYFVGDDYSLFIENNFYHSWKNFYKLITSECVSDSDAVLNRAQADLGSGGVSYRPVWGITYFFDVWLWRTNPFGYHLHNVILHFLTTIFVYFVVFFLLQDRTFALLSAILFCVHPLNAETVSAIGYRASGLSCFFFLLAFLSYMRHYDLEPWKGRLCFLGAYLFFFLAVFSKESAVVFPGVLFAYDWFFRRKEVLAHRSQSLVRYSGFLLILAFYLYIYIFVFPNKTISSPQLFGGSLLSHGITIVWIFAQYGLAFIFPWTVKSLPPLYLPDIGPLGGIKTWAALGILAGLVFLMAQLARREKTATFFTIWILISFIPVSNIIPIANPMAYRFMYLPLFGVSVLLAIFFSRILPQAAVCRTNPSLAKIIQNGFIGGCIVMTILLNRAWETPYSMAAHMYRDFPDSPIACLFFAEQKIVLHRLKEAKPYLEKALALGLDEARMYYYLGLSESDPEAGRQYFEKGIVRFPGYAESYRGLGRYYFLKNQFKQAAFYFEKCSGLIPRNYKAYGYLIEIYLMSGQVAKAEDFLRRAQQNIDSIRELDFLKKMFTPEWEKKFPKDLGL